MRLRGCTFHNPSRSPPHALLARCCRVSTTRRRVHSQKFAASHRLSHTRDDERVDRNFFFAFLLPSDRTGDRSSQGRILSLVENPRSDTPTHTSTYTHTLSHTVSVCVRAIDSFDDGDDGRLHGRHRLGSGERCHRGETTREDRVVGGPPLLRGIVGLGSGGEEGTQASGSDAERELRARVRGASIQSGAVPPPRSQPGRRAGGARGRLR